MALIVNTQHVSVEVIWGGGFAIGVVMLFLTLTGLLGWYANIIPKTVIRGIQLGLGIQLSLLAVRDYIPADKTTGYIFAFIAFLIGLMFIGNLKFPLAIFILLLGVGYMLLFNFNILQNLSFSLPVIRVPQLSYQDIISGFILQAIPQIPLSLGNSIFATKQCSRPVSSKKVTVKKSGLPIH